MSICKRCQQEVYLPCHDPDECDELKAVQSKCDHLWDFNLADEMKVCALIDCGLEEAMSGEELTDHANYLNEMRD